jgi:hypothetical protein|tara:strand:+ start:342 stop:458 length:117 start_codon:yes stop_codon:yes gene_type:complete
VNEKKFKALEEKTSNEVEMAAQTYEEGKEKKKTAKVIS